MGVKSLNPFPDLGLYLQGSEFSAQLLRQTKLITRILISLIKLHGPLSRGQSIRVRSCDSKRTPPPQPLPTLASFSCQLPALELRELISALSTVEKGPGGAKPRCLRKKKKKGS